MIQIRPATIKDLEYLAILFDAYRVFYKQPSNITGAESFLKDRLQNGESIILIAIENDTVLGFTQLYPTFSSVSMERSYILNDLYVVPQSRRKGIGKKLLNAAQSWVKTKKYKGLALETAIDNPAQGLYEKEGWIKDEGFYHYFWSRPA